jgi:hypothetical protein
MTPICREPILVNLELAGIDIPPIALTNGTTWIGNFIQAEGII